MPASSAGWHKFRTAYPFSSASARCGVGHGAPDCVDHGSARLPAQLVGVPKPVHVRRCRSPLSRGVPWPEGFRCPGCGDGSSYRLASRALLQCRACRRQTSVTAGTVLDRTRLPLPLWFAAAYLVTTHTPGFSALQLQRQLGLARYESAWLRQPQDLAARHPPRRRRQAPAPLRRRIRLPLQPTPHPHGGVPIPAGPDHPARPDHLPDVVCC